MAESKCFLPLHQCASSRYNVLIAPYQMWPERSSQVQSGRLAIPRGGQPHRAGNGGHAGPKDGGWSVLGSYMNAFFESVKLSWSSHDDWSLDDGLAGRMKRDFGSLSGNSEPSMRPGVAPS